MQQWQRTVTAKCRRVRYQHELSRIHSPDGLSVPRLAKALTKEAWKRNPNPLRPVDTRDPTGLLTAIAAINHSRLNQLIRDSFTRLQVA